MTKLHALAHTAGVVATPRTGHCRREFGRDEPGYKDKRGTVRFIPDSPRGFRIVAEAASGEFAEELCDFARRRISNSPNVLNH